ncbi:helix-turn-helix domain-containing protein [Micromonospora sp. NPDC047465]|uniref:helix-turn-helix domain-containing protein n=1 Tax=Micromonospora sp. NPDC047465 TaxID=3154813 RepID=UPI00340ADA1E
MGVVTGDDTSGVGDVEWWTTSDVAAYLGVQVSTVTNYRKRGQMPAPDMTVGRTHMWRPARIRSWQQGRPRPGVGGRRAGQSGPAS